MGVGYQELQPGLKRRIGLGGGSEATGNWIVKPIFNKVKLSASSSTVNLGFTGFDMENDTLLVFKNSTFMFPNEYYNVISNTQIQATGGESWAAGDEFNFVALVINNAPTVVKQSSFKNVITISEPKSFIELGMKFDHTQDTIMVFKNGVYQELNVDYTTDDIFIYPKGIASFNASVKNSITFNIIVIRNVIDGAVLTYFDGAYLKEKSVTEDKLDPAILQKAYSYTDKAKNDLLGGAGPAYDTLKEIEQELTKDDNALTTMLSKINTLDLADDPYVVSTGAIANAYIASVPKYTVLSKGIGLYLEIDVTNTGGSTLNLNGLGIKPIFDSKGNQVNAGDLVVGIPYHLKYNGSAFILQGKGGDLPTPISGSKFAPTDDNLRGYTTLEFDFIPNIVYVHLDFIRNNGETFNGGVIGVNINGLNTIGELNASSVLAALSGFGTNKLGISWSAGSMYPAGTGWTTSTISWTVYKI